MACCVYRAVLLGNIKDPQLNTAKLISFYRAPAANQFRTNDTFTSTHDTAGRTSKLEINVAVETDTTADSHDGYTVCDRKFTYDPSRQV
jgi:hypothetical protein